MRLYLFPISAKRTLIYAKRLQRPPKEKQTWGERITNKASDTWVKWESAESGWQKKVTEWGNKAFSQIPYQEWGLKSVPALNEKRKERELSSKDKIELIYPPSVFKQDAAIESLRKLATERQDLDRRKMWWSIIAIPFTAPFMLIPVIPNLPFFYVAFRAWSHWKALSGSKHIQWILENGLAVPAPSDILSRIYNLGPIPKQHQVEIKEAVKKAKEGKEGAAREDAVREVLNGISDPSIDTLEIKPALLDRLLLEQGTGKLVGHSLDIPEVEAEIERALKQVGKSLEKEKHEHEEQMRQLSSAKEPQATATESPGQEKEPDTTKPPQDPRDKGL